MTVFKTCIISACTVLAACGGGSGSAAATPATQVAAPKAVVIDAEGDSLIWGYAGTANGVQIQSASNPPALMQRQLQAKLGNMVTVQNTAKVGATASQSLNGTSPYAVPLATRLATDDARIVLGDYAVNDSIDTPIETYQANLVAWISAVRAAGKTPVLEEPNPVCSSVVPNVLAFKSAMDAIASQQGVLLIQQYDYVMSLPNWQSMLQADCIHPTDALYQLKATREVAALEPLVQGIQ